VTWAKTYLLPLAVALGVCAVLIGVSRIGSSSATETLITPNQSIGLVSVGMTQSQISRVLGHGHVVRRVTLSSLGQGIPSFHATISFPGYVIVAYPRSGIQASYIASGPYAGQSVALLTTDPRYRTGTGLGVGSAVSSIEAGSRCYLQKPVTGNGSLVASDPNATQICVDPDPFSPLGAGYEAATYYTGRQGRIATVYMADQPRDLFHAG
jgi:hypothetical protein